jgi:hypothetical protein
MIEFNGVRFELGMRVTWMHHYRMGGKAIKFPVACKIVSIVEDRAEVLVLRPNGAAAETRWINLRNLVTE